MSHVVATDAWPSVACTRWIGGLREDALGELGLQAGEPEGRPHVEAPDELRGHELLDCQDAQGHRRTVDAADRPRWLGQRHALSRASVNFNPGLI
jgi:hypothetical protein